MDSDVGTDLFCKIVENAGLHWQFHIHCAGHPAQLTLPDVEDTIYASHLFSGNLKSNIYVRGIMTAIQDRISRRALTTNPSHASLATCSTLGFNFANRKKYISPYCC